MTPPETTSTWSQLQEHFRWLNRLPAWAAVLVAVAVIAFFVLVALAAQR